MIYGRQEDAHELYQVLLLSMTQEMTPPTATPNSTVRLGLHGQYVCQRRLAPLPVTALLLLTCMACMYRQETTLVDQLFRGMLASQLLCPECNHASTSFESFLDLQLEIHGYTDTLEEMLEGVEEVVSMTSPWKITCVPVCRYHSPPH
jgi:hypothetical protein